MRRIKRVGALKGRNSLYGTDNPLFRLLTLQFLRRSYDTLPESFGSDLRQLGPIHVCTCGCQVFNVLASFEDYELVWYFLDATCVNCGNLVIVPCPVDKHAAQAQ